VNFVLVIMGDEGSIKSNSAWAKKHPILADFAIGGSAAAFSKTLVAPIERVKMLLQTQDSNPLIKSGQVSMSIFGDSLCRLRNIPALATASVV
jgi:hypothetical protein